MKKYYLLLMIMIVLSTSVYSDTSFNFLTKGWADTLYCSLNGDCNISSLSVGNLTVYDQFLNVSVVDYNVTGNMSIEGCVVFPLTGFYLCGDYNYLGNVTAESYNNLSWTSSEGQDGVHDWVFESPDSDDLWDLRLTVNNTLYLNGTLNISGNIYPSISEFSYNTGNIFLYDIDGEYHHLNADAETRDELLANVFITPLTVETFYNDTGTYINITSDEDYFAFYLGNSTTSKGYRLNYKNIILELNEGTNSTPILNMVYIRIVSDTPTWTVSTSEPTVQHAMVSRVLVGDKHIYAAALQEDGNNGFLKRTQRRFRKQGLLYESGFDYNATTNSLNISEGRFITGVYDQITDCNLSTSDNFFVVNSTGDYNTLTSISQITKYSDGGLIGTNKYYNIVWGVIPFDGLCNLYAVVQLSPSTDYTSVIDAYADPDNTLSVYPADDFLRINYLPVARTIINSQSDLLQLLPNSQYAEDYRGGVAGGVSSGGGISEADPLALHKDGDVLPTGNFDWNNYNITNGDYLEFDNVNVTGNLTMSNDWFAIQDCGDYVLIGDKNVGSC